VEVLAIEQFSLAVLYPFGSRERLAFWAMPISTRVVRDPLMLTGVALLDVTTQGSSAAGFDGMHHTALRRRQGRIMLGSICLAVAT
jgi:hypothetical protein